METVSVLISRATKSATVWGATILLVLSTSESLLSAVLEPIGAMSADAAVRVSALLLLITRLRSIVVPVLKAVQTDDTDQAGA